MIDAPRYEDVRDFVQDQFDTWLELARDTPELRTVSVWRERVAALERDIAAKGSLEGYVLPIEALESDTKKRSALATLALALAARAHFGGHWRYCFAAACEVRQLDVNRVHDWLRAYKPPETPETHHAPQAPQTPQAHRRELF